MSATILQGDCLERMAELDDASIDAIVTDPPYGIGFMGHEWDQPGEDHGPVRSNGDPAPFASGRAYPGKHVVGGREQTPTGQRRDRNPAPSGFTKPKTAKEKKLGKRGESADRGAAMDAGRYDLSLTANQRYQAWCEAWAREAYRVLKPGGHLLASCGTRTSHRLAAGVEDAGFEIRDSLLWLYGSGFPKSLDVSKAIDSALGSQPTVVGEETIRGFMPRSDNETRKLTEPTTPEAAQWQGWGTALKPSHEPIVVARKPLIGTVAANVLEHGVGGLNIDGCRIGTSKDVPASPRRAEQGAAYGDLSKDPGDGSGWDADTGRWPANVVLSEEAAAELDEQTGELAAGNHPARRNGRPEEKVYGSGWTAGTEGERRPTETGGASRFFYCAKTSRAERNAGLEAFPDVEGGFRSETSGQHLTRRDGGDPGPTKNGHPTVKPINLMRWLVRLVTPPGGLILDPFLGSGTTGCAAVLEGFEFLGIEREAEYVAIAEARIAFWAQHTGREVEDVLGLLAVSERRREDLADNLSLFEQG